MACLFNKESPVRFQNLDYLLLGVCTDGREPEQVHLENLARFWESDRFEIRKIS